MQYGDIPIGAITAASLQMAADAAKVSVEELIARLLNGAAKKGENSLVKDAGFTEPDNIRSELRNLSDYNRYRMWALVAPEEAKISSSTPGNSQEDLIRNFALKRDWVVTVTSVNDLSSIVSVQSAKCWCGKGYEYIAFRLAYTEALLRDAGIKPGEHVSGADF